jgi:hypothetical protein
MITDIASLIAMLTQIEKKSSMGSGTPVVVCHGDAFLDIVRVRMVMGHDLEDDPAGELPTVVIEVDDE